jgi:alanine-glyoxylate transaminase/serine-glyoxylate transaminase/serine-pyruvate transaminase
MESGFLKLMIPGPIQPDEEVLKAMGSPVRAHYGDAWLKIYNETLNQLRQVLNTSGDVFLMVGSGTCAIDACFGSALRTGDQCLVGINGYFGERLKSVAEGYGLDVIPVTAEWGQTLRPEDFERAFQQHPEAQMAAVVHLETSTTIVNPIEAIGPVVREHGGLFLVDAVSSLGGLPFDMDGWKVDLCASASQKCLGAPPGLAPVALNARAWEMIDQEPNKGHGWYGNLRVWRQYAQDWGDWHPSPITMATNNVMALHASLTQLLAEGIPERLERYRSLALRLRSGLRRICLKPYTPDEILAPVLTAAYGPDGVPTSKIVQYLEQEHAIKISGGLGQLKDKIFRIGHMAPTTSEADIDDLVAKLGEFCARQG